MSTVGVAFFILNGEYIILSANMLISYLGYVRPQSKFMVLKTRHNKFFSIYEVKINLAVLDRDLMSLIQAYLPYVRSIFKRDTPFTCIRTNKPRALPS